MSLLIAGGESFSAKQSPWAEISGRKAELSLKFPPPIVLVTRKRTVLHSRWLYHLPMC